MSDTFRFATHTVPSRDFTSSQKAASLIFELQHKAAQIEVALAEEVRRGGIVDPAHREYSMLARSLRSRWENLQKTISRLEEMV